MGIHWRALIAVAGLVALSAGPPGLLALTGSSSQIPGLERILKRPPALTTSYADAVYMVPFLDEFDPQEFSPLDTLKRTPDGGLEFPPGLYQFDLRSFCVQPGTRGPRRNNGGGDRGYVYAPMKGPRADILKHMIGNSFRHPEIPQEDLQVLIWAVLSYTKLSAMSRTSQMLAARLLTPAELAELNGGALGLIPQSLIDRAYGALPAQLAQVLRAEQELRELLTSGRDDVPYEELERVAVLENDSEPDEEESPRPTWSLRPEGFFVRYFVHDYTRVTVQMSYPEWHRVRRDTRGRIVRVEDDSGSRVAVTYDDGIEPARVRGEPTLHGYAFRSVRFERAGPKGRGTPLSAEWKGRGWTFAGVPSGGGTPDNAAGARYPELARRYRWAVDHKAQLSDLDRQYAAHGTPDVILNLGQLTQAVKELIASEEDQEDEQQEWIAGHLDVLRKAWQDAVWLREMYTETPDAERESVGNDAVARDPYTQRHMFYHRLQKWGLHKIADPDFENVPRPFRRPMYLAGAVR